MRQIEVGWASLAEGASPLISPLISPQISPQRILKAPDRETDAALLLCMCMQIQAWSYRGGVAAECAVRKMSRPGLSLAVRGGARRRGVAQRRGPSRWLSADSPTGNGNLLRGPWVGSSGLTT